MFLERTVSMKLCGQWNSPHCKIHLYEGFLNGEDDAPYQGVLPTIRPTIYYGRTAGDFKLFLSNIPQNTIPSLAALEPNDAVYIRDIRPDSRIHMDMGVNESPKPRLIDDIFIFRTHKEHFAIRCDKIWTHDYLKQTLQGYITTLKTPGMLADPDLNVVWLAPQNKQGVWVNSDRRAVVEEVFTTNDMNYGSSYYIQEAEPNEDCKPLIELRTTDISEPADSEGYPWILKKWAGLEYWTSWDGIFKGRQTITIRNEIEYPDPLAGLSAGPAIATPFIGDNLPYP
ncbi:uncharacterized protein TRUGW13939_11266 [Talaromyces rugulosus]|uniref:Uncharacterized protein n=1 Tax=Talaromyces rugulosus TaxID=121627 RepID=A0A7H8RHP3_TALRU|nr:uncharacterized protein TRUGW13939_11266 [Talaromyces rugulosus]QKX64093.1 hypothetical protein TRUGW13939_11266 [Talaromyces rugulosus]